MGGNVGLFLEKKVVKDKAQIRFSGPVIDQSHPALFLLDLPEERFDELIEMVNLLELAAAILVQLAVPGEDVQFF
jgi:hypothetical protein